MATKNELTKERLKELLKYDPDSGIFIWITFKNFGKIAGSLNTNGYLYIGVDYKNYRAHIVAHLYMLGEFPNGDLDHINRIKLDNRWENIRKATKSQNMWNVEGVGSNTNIKGICYSKRYDRYDCCFYCDGKRIQKTFPINKYPNKEIALEEAISWIIQTRALYHGEFAAN